MQPDTSDQAQASSGIIAGEDAKMRITTYPVDQEAVDLCTDARVSTACLYQASLWKLLLFFPLGDRATCEGCGQSVNLISACNLVYCLVMLSCSSTC